MKPLNNWNNITPQNEGELARIEPNGYICQIRGVKDVASKGYLEVYLEIAQGEFKGYFEKQYKQFGGTWKCIYRIFYTSSNAEFAESTERKFKGFITSIEESNKGYIWNWDEQSLKQKYVGFLFGEEEFKAQDGSIKTTVKPRFSRSVETIRSGNFQIPKLKELKNKNQSNNSPFNQPYNTSTTQNYAQSTVDIASDDLPF